MWGGRKASGVSRHSTGGGSGGSGDSSRSALPFLPVTNPARARQLQERLLVEPTADSGPDRQLLPSVSAAGARSSQLSPLVWPGQTRSGKRGHGCASYEDVLRASTKKLKIKPPLSKAELRGGNGQSVASSRATGMETSQSGSSGPSDPSSNSLRPADVPEHVADIIERVRSDPRVGFFYMVPSLPTSAVGRHYYCLRVVPYSVINQEQYLTISRHGVTQVLNKEAEFVPLNDWEADYTMFLKLRKIRTFGQFRMWKQFCQWRVNVRWYKFHLARRSLAHNLFILKPSLSAAILSIKHLCNTVATMGVVRVDDSITYTLENFHKTKAEQLSEVSESLSEFRLLVGKIVRTACNTALLEAGFPTDEYIEELAVAVRCGQTVWKTKLHLDPQQCLSMFKVGDYSQQMSFTEQADKRRQCQRLTRFIYMVDLILMSCKHQLVMNTVIYLERELISRMERVPPEDQLIITLNKKPEKKPSIASEHAPGSNVDGHPPPPPEVMPEPPPEPNEEEVTDAPVQPLFVTELEFRGATLRLVPPAREFETTVEQLLLDSRELVEHMENLFIDDTLVFITRPTINGKTLGDEEQQGPDLEDVLDSDQQLSTMSVHISDMVGAGFQAAETYMQTFEGVKDWFYENMRTNMKEFADIGCDVKKFQFVLAKYTTQMNEVKNIPADMKLGVFCVNAMTVRDLVKPSPEICLEEIHKIMPVSTKARVEALMEESQDAHYKLEITPTTTEEYVTFLSFLDDISIRIESLEHEADVVCQMVELMEDYETPIPPEYIAEFNTLNPTVSILHDLTDNCVSDRDSLVERLSASLAKDIKKLTKDVEVVTQQIDDPTLLQIESDHAEVRSRLSNCTSALHQEEQLAKTYKEYQKKFRIEITKLEQLENAQDELRLRTLLWDSLDEWDTFLTGLLVTPFHELDVEELNQVLAKFNKTVVQLEKGLPPNNVAAVLKRNVNDFRIKLATITDLRNTTLKRRHWETIQRLLNHQVLNLDDDKPLTLQLLIDYQAFTFAEQIKEISGQASAEASLEALLVKVENVWKSTEFTVVPLADQKDVYILGGTDDIQQLLDESNINIQTISSSRHVGPIMSRVEDWEKRLSVFANTLDEWLACQRTWLYLGSVFCAPDIQRQLPTEAKLFITVDKSYKDIMRRVNKVPLAIRAATQAGMLDALQTNNGLLDQIMKCLEAYLESKRVIFPRFYFLSNDELLEILAQTRNPQAVEPHLKKCFDAIHKLEFGKREGADGQVEMTNEILAMLSPEKEYVLLTKGLKARGNVEDWLGKVEEAMFASLKRCMKQALSDYGELAKDVWVAIHPSQVVLTVAQMLWCRDVHAVLDGDIDRQAAMRAFEEEMFENLSHLAGMVRGELKDLARNVVCALITLTVHSRDIVTSLVQSGCDSSSSFEWLKQLRYYWSSANDTCEAAMSLARHTYGYEYLGASPRLVITPLTDRCYLCLMGALQLDLGGAPAGPAGTGKTETTKDLAKSLAIQCVVFNCSEGIDHKMMGRFFSGLAQSGAWCCFDEFNRIDIEVLSVIAQQLITIRNAKVMRSARFMFEGREIKLVRSCASFITMNPGYAGRTELPDNLKALFRPISMMVPDYGLIAEVILYSEGFESSHNLARKMVHLFRLCSEQLSQQSHYDFGMRALKSVLVMAGRLKRENPQINEDIVLVRALRDANVPKFLADDLVLFKAILEDLFPGAVIPEIDYGQLKECIVDVMLSMKIQTEPCQIHKVIQFHETMIVRHGVMLVGPPGGGKTTIYRILQKTLTKMESDGHESPYYKPVYVEVLNPKSITMGELYGEVNLLTLEWRDGILGRLVRSAVSDETEAQHWIVFDGPVDAVWIENMNTVLDDNKLLCLTNSERIKLTPGVRMVFEVDDLAQASPATVSRCGMVFVDAGEMKWMPFVKTWLDELEESGQLKDYMRTFIQELFEKYVEDGLIYVAKKCVQAMAQAEVNKVEMMCRLMVSLLFGPGGLDPNKEPLRLNELLSQTFVFCYLWTVGGNLTEPYREPFEVFVRKQLEDSPEAKLPTHSDLWSFRMDYTNKKMDPWERIVPPFQFDSEMSFVNIVVPTVDTVRYSYLLDKLLSVDTSVMFTGATGVGKSIIARSQLLMLGATVVPVFFNFSANTTAMRAQEVVESKLERRRRTMLAAPAEKKVVVFIDDVNMPRPEIYGAQPPVELLRQLLDFGGMYDRKELFWKTVENVIVCAACAPPGGGRHQLNGRFLRHFCMLLIPPPTEATLVHIFRSIVHGFLAPFATPVKALADAIVSSAVEIYCQISIGLLPTPSKSHYVFNLRDLSKCINGVLQADPSVIIDKEPMFRLFCHEAQRVFHDRLITQEDKLYFNTLMLEVAGRNFAINMEPQTLTDTPILFGDFMKMGAEEDQKIYDEFKDHEKLQRILQDYLDDYNVSGGREMQLVFFRDAVEHVTRLARILRTDRGNALLVGVGGTGKQSLTRLASHINNASCFMIALCRGYDHTSFRDDIRQLFWSAGVLRKKTVFFFADYQIAQEEFMEDIDSILNSGEVPSLYDMEEYEKVIIASRPFAKKVGIPEGDRDAIYGHFISHVRSNLHIVLSMSPAGDAFRFYCRMFPAVVNCCTIDWFNEWPPDALLEVAKKLLKADEIGDADLTASICQMCVTAHQDVVDARLLFLNQLKRYYYVTPTSYLELINLYGTMLRDKKADIIGARERLSNGLTKLKETNSLVDTMSVELVALAPELKKKSEDTELLMARLAKDQAAADKVRQVVQTEEAAAKIKAEETQALADDAQKDLNEALPALEGAVKALDSLDKSDISEIKVFNKPPEMVQIVLEAVCILLGAKTDWSTAKQVLGDSNFLKRLMEYDKENIPETVLKKIKKYIDDPKFVPDVVEKVSKACKSMCLWVRAIDLFARIFKEVGPKRERLQAAETELALVMATLKEKQDRLAAVEAQIAELQSFYDQSIGEKRSLEDRMSVTSSRLARASKLTSALGDEGERWAINVETLTKELETTVGNMFIGAASVSYLGAFTSQFRDDLLNHWIEMCRHLSVPIADNFKLSDVLADPYQIRLWNACGLPSDDVSTTNAILSCRSRRWPLMIDPQDQANQWIRRMEAVDGLKVVKMSDGLLLRVLETCIRVGLPLLIEAVGETLEAALEPILLRQTYLSGGRLLIKLGDSEVDYEKSFRMYMTTKLGNPHYLPEVCIKVTLVNFTVTQTGLEDQLLGDVVRLEEPKIEETRNKLIVQINSDKSQLRSIEDKILYMLFTSEGNILDNEQLIVTLNESKITSRDISIRLTEAESTEIKISAAREKYRPVALRGSIVYFVIAQLTEVDAMYQYSLKYFNQIFTSNIQSTEPNADLEDHLADLIQNTTTAAYTDVARGLFEKDKLIFSFVLCVDIMRQQGSATDAQWNFLLRGAPHLADELGEKPSPVKWYSDTEWKAALTLELAFPDQFSDFGDVLIAKQLIVEIGNESIILNPEAPADWARRLSAVGRRVSSAVGRVKKLSLQEQSEQPKILDTTPDDQTANWLDRLSSMERLLMVRTVKQQQLPLAVTEFVRQNLGAVFIERPAIDLPTLFPNIDRYTPLIFVLSQGTDPMGEFMTFTRDREMDDRVSAISLGQGQGPVAEKAINDAAKTGDWVFLQNCHLSVSWMPSLEAIIKELPESTTTVHEGFRLFLSSMPAKAFPVEILQNSVKVTNEPPRGLRNSLRQAFSVLSTEFFDDNPLEISWRRMVFGLCFFHAVIQERKKYGPLGWNIGYEFTKNDRDFALDNLRLFCKDGTIPWEALQYITGEITYGGRVTDNWDQRCLATILTNFFSPSAMAADHKYSPSGIYYAPDSGALHEYRQYIDALPVADSPEIFGMHVNADVVSKVQETHRLLSTMLSMQPGLATSGGGQGSGDQFVYELAETMETRIPTKIDMELAHKKLFELDDRGRMNSLTTVLVQEVDRYNGLLGTIHSTLNDLKRAIRGLVVMSEDLDRVYKAFVNNQVPGLWARVAYLSVKSLGSWVNDLIMRVDAFTDWSRRGPPPTFWFSGFFFPQGFLTGILQNFARKHSLPIDQLRFEYHVQEVWRDQADIMKWRQGLTSQEVEAEDPNPGPFHRPASGKGFISWIDEELDAPEEGLLIHGLFIDAGRWDAEEMTLADPIVGELKSVLPVLHMLPSFLHVPDPSDYTCPLYRTPVRAGILSTTGHSTNFVVDIQLPTSQPEEHWITQGTALLTLLQD